MKPQVFYEKGVNKMGKPFIKKTTRLKSPIMNHTGKIKGFIHQERVNYISGNKYMNTVSKMSPSHHKMSHSHHTSLKNIVNDMLKQKSPMRNYVETTRKTPTKKTSTKKKTPTKKKTTKKTPTKKKATTKKTPTKKKTTKKTTKKTSTKKKETTKKKPTKKTNIKKRPLKRPVNKNKNY